MPSESHPIDASTSRALIAPFVLVAALGVVALVARFDPWNESLQGPSADAPFTDTLVEWGD